MRSLKYGHELLEWWRIVDYDDANACSNDDYPGHIEFLGEFRRHGHTDCYGQFRQRKRNYRLCNFL